MKKLLILAMVLSALLIAVPTSASPATLYVDDDGQCGGNAPCYTTIQAAVDAATTGDTIIVMDGIYTENVAVNKDHLTIKSENGAKKTIVQPQISEQWSCIFWVGADYVSISGFTVQNNTSGSGIQLAEANNCSINGNIVLNNRYGIYLRWYSNNNIVINNTASFNDWYTILLENSSDNIVSSNNVNLNNGIGIAVSYSSNSNAISNNAVSNNGGGIWLYESCNNNALTNNYVSNCYSGIRLMGSSSNNTISHNILSSNSWGIGMEDSPNNIIYLNDFIDSRANSNCINVWNSPEKLTYTYSGNIYTNYLGNYWSDYDGSDANGDGIGDTPYNINGEKDNYPLMRFSENYTIGPVPATVDLDPDALGVKSKAKWITAYIELPDSYDVQDIDIVTVTLEGTIAAELCPTEVGDYDDDGVPDLMVKFDWQALVEYLDGTTGEVTLMVSGELSDGTPFEGSDAITVINPGK